MSPVHNLRMTIIILAKDRMNLTRINMNDKGCAFKQHTITEGKTHIENNEINSTKKKGRNVEVTEILGA